MSELVADCPRCGATKITFDLSSSNLVDEKFGWQKWHEAFGVCRHCRRSTIFILCQISAAPREHLHHTEIRSLTGSVNNYFSVNGVVSVKDRVRVKPPEHLPEKIKAAFDEGAICMTVNCFNAGATMFRLCIDHATLSLLPEEDTAGLNRQVRRSLGLRLQWLFENNRLPETLKELSACIKEDGNDGAHAGTLKKEDAEDLLDFTFHLLERLYTEPERLRLAKTRRDARRTPPTP